MRPYAVQPPPAAAASRAFPATAAPPQPPYPGRAQAVPQQQQQQPQAYAAPTTPVPPGTLPPGTVVHVGDCIVTVERFLSEGGFAHVYLATSTVPLPKGAPNATTRHVLKRMVVPDKRGVAEVGKEVEVMVRFSPSPTHPRNPQPSFRRADTGSVRIPNDTTAPAQEPSQDCQHDRSVGRRPAGRRRRQQRLRDLHFDGMVSRSAVLVLHTVSSTLLTSRGCTGGGIIDMMNTRLQNRLTEGEILKIFSDVVEVCCRPVRAHVLPR